MNPHILQSLSSMMHHSFTLGVNYYCALIDWMCCDLRNIRSKFVSKSDLRSLNEAFLQSRRHVLPPHGKQHIAIPPPSPPTELNNVNEIILFVDLILIIFNSIISKRRLIFVQENSPDLSFELANDLFLMSEVNVIVSEVIKVCHTNCVGRKRKRGDICAMVFACSVAEAAALLVGWRPQTALSIFSALLNCWPVIALLPAINVLSCVPALPGSDLGCCISR